MARHGLLLAAITLLLGPGCAREAPPPAGLVLVSLDTTRPDHLSAYGYARDTSPRLAALARQGVRFDAAYAASPATAPSHATLFTSLHPHQHGTVKNGVPLDPAHVTLAESLGAAGFQTAGVVSSFVLARRFGLAQGFDHFEDEFSAAEATETVAQWEGHAVEGSFDRRADHTTRRALRWLRREREAGRRFFLFVHYFDPHLPYEAPRAWRSRFVPPQPKDRRERLVGRYDAEIAFTDAAVGRLLDGLEALGLAEDTLVVVTADHGEGLLDHGELSHGVFLYEEAVRIPLILRWPAGLPSGEQVEEPVGLVDVAPTLLGLLGVPSPPAATGRSLVPRLRGEPLPAAPIFLHRRSYPPSRVGMLNTFPVRGGLYAVREGSWKYVEGPKQRTTELYDLAADPDERTDLAREQPERVEAMAARLHAWLEESTPGQPAPELSDAERRGLEALGYVE